MLFVCAPGTLIGWHASKKSQFQASSTSGTKENKSQSSDSKKSTKEKKTQELDEKVIQSKITVAKGMHFAPTFLLLTIIACSGFMTVMAYRDMFGTVKWFLARPMQPYCRWYPGMEIVPGRVQCRREADDG